MSVHLKGLGTEKEKCSIHSMPCKIHADDTSNVSAYFKPIQHDNGSLTSSFRGRPLDGKEIRLPENYIGMVFKESASSGIEGEVKSLILTNTFDSITYWNWDKKPSKNDSLISALDWIGLSEVVHGPVGDELET